MPLPSFAVVPDSTDGTDSADGAGSATVSGYPVVLLGCRPGVGDEAEPVPLPRAVARGAKLGVDVVGHLRRAKATGAAGEVTLVPLVPTDQVSTTTVLIVGLGDGSPASLQRAGAAAARAAGGSGPVFSALAATGPTGPTRNSAGVRRFVEGYALAAYAVPRRTTSKAGSKEPAPAQQVDLASRRTGAAADEFAAEVRRGEVTARAVHLARDLANTPAGEKSPQWLAAQAVSAGTAAGLTVRVRDEHELAAEGFGGLIGVGQGSARPPRFVELAYRPPRSARRPRQPRHPRHPRRPHLVLVGKGIVFDSGGISIKPAAGMELMKTDMAGAAAVLGVMTALRDLDVDVRVTGLLAIAENMPGAAALRPSDVITPFGGRLSVEITNTDAEGRLVLADGLAYADQVLRADAVIDIATLTGAATVALGRLDAPMYVNDEPLAAALAHASALSGERLWRMPLVDDYRSALDSGTADLVNAVTDRTTGGGSITAALFLREFAGSRPWAHLDIAGTGRAEGPSGELSKGATGFGVRLLLRLLESW